jgi:hypothetical protein
MDSIPKSHDSKNVHIALTVLHLVGKCKITAKTVAAFLILIQGCTPTHSKDEAMAVTPFP